MKIYLRNQENFHPDTLKFYKENFEIVEEKDSEVIVINTFEPIKTDKIVVCNSTGVEHISSPTVLSLRGEDLSDLTAVPELCLGMAIFLTRLYKQEEIRGKTLGLIGYGRIARKFEKYAEDLGMKILSYDNKDPMELIKLNELLIYSDIVSLHITADEANRNFMNQEKFGMMKDGSIFLNSARGWLVEKEALKWALENKLAAAWSDFAIEFEHENIVYTPHLGGATKESKQKSELIIAKKLLEYGRTAA